MRYKEGEDVSFKVLSPIDESVNGKVIIAIPEGILKWEEYGEPYYLVEYSEGWDYHLMIIDELIDLIGQDNILKLEDEKKYWFVREKNIIGKWDGKQTIPELINFKLLKYNFKKDN